MHILSEPWHWRDLVVYGMHCNEGQSPGRGQYIQIIFIACCQWWMTTTEEWHFFWIDFKKLEYGQEITSFSRT